MHSFFIVKIGKYSLILKHFGILFTGFPSYYKSKLLKSWNNQAKRKNDNNRLVIILLYIKFQDGTINMIYQSS